MKKYVTPKTLLTSLFSIMVPSLVMLTITADYSARATEVPEQDRLVFGETEIWFSDFDETTLIEVDPDEATLTDAETDLLENSEDIEEGVLAIPAEEDFPLGFDRAVLAVPEIGTFQEFQQFVARIRSIEDEALTDGAIRYYPKLIDAKHLAIMEAADQMLPKVEDEDAIFSIHAVKFKEFRGYKFSSDVAQSQFGRYSQALSQHPIKQVRSIPEGYELIMATVFTALAEAPEDMQMELVENLFSYIDEYGVNEVSADTSESISLMYDAESYPNLTPVLFQGLADRFEQAPEDDAKLQALAASYREQAEALQNN